MTEERDIGGIRCMEVLSLLSAYLDGEADAADRRRIEAHVAECDNCARFGGAFRGLVEALRRQDSAELSAEAAERLERRLKL